MGTRVTRADPVPREETSPAAGRRESIWQFGLVADYRAPSYQDRNTPNTHQQFNSCIQ